MAKSKSKKKKKTPKKMSQTELMKAVRKPAIPRTKVINSKGYDRKDKRWKDPDPEEDA